jgi:hypothetical protein
MARDLYIVLAATGFVLMGGALIDDAPMAFAVGLTLAVYGGRRFWSRG